jgi:hypothetical protein
MQPIYINNKNHIMAIGRFGTHIQCLNDHMTNIWLLSYDTNAKLYQPLPVNNPPKFQYSKVTPKNDPLANNNNVKNPLSKVILRQPNSIRPTTAFGKTVPIPTQKTIPPPNYKAVAIIDSNTLKSNEFKISEFYVLYVTICYKHGVYKTAAFPDAIKNLTITPNTDSENILPDSINTAYNKLNEVINKLYAYADEVDENGISVPANTIRGWNNNTLWDTTLSYKDDVNTNYTISDVLKRLSHIYAICDRLYKYIFKSPRPRLPDINNDRKTNLKEYVKAYYAYNIMIMQPYINYICKLTNLGDINKVYIQYHTDWTFFRKTDRLIIKDYKYPPCRNEITTLIKLNIRHPCVYLYIMKNYNNAAIIKYIASEIPQACTFNPKLKRSDQYNNNNPEKVVSQKYTLQDYYDFAKNTYNTQCSI